jgi:GlpG protein
MFPITFHCVGAAVPRIEFNAPVTVYYALAAVTATILPVQKKLAVHGPIRLLDGDFLLSLFTWTLAHGGMTHLLSNFVVILLAGPLLEDRFGSLRMLGVLVAASVLVGLAHCILDPRGALIGASGTVFCLIMLTGRSGTIPLTMLLVATPLSRPGAGGAVRERRYTPDYAHPRWGTRRHAGPGHARSFFLPPPLIPPSLIWRACKHHQIHPRP